MTARFCHPGYSLVELLVALLLLGMIALAAQSGLHFGTQVWQSATTTAADFRQIAAAQAVLREVLSNAQPRFEGEYSTFSGQPKSLSFDTAPPGVFERFGTAHVTLKVAPDAGHQSLQIILESQEDAATTRHASLASGFDDLHFEYLDAGDHSGTWLANWQDRTRLPTAVRLVSDDPAHWPPLVVHLVIGETPTCLFDPERMTCRRS